MNPTARPRLFALLWLLAGLCVVPLSAALLFAAAEVIRWAIEHSSGAPNYDYWDNNFALLLSLYGVISGCCVGILQQVIVARTWRRKLSGWWRASTLGGLLGGMAVWLLMEPFDYFHRLWSLNLTPSQYSALHFALPALVLVGCLAAAQASWLRRHASGAGLWLAAHALALLLPLAFAFAQTGPAALSSSVTGTVWLLSHFCFLTIFSGIVMYRAMTRSLRHDKAKRINPAPAGA
ncbi:MAG: hypothetical protein OXE46_01305 [Chloroflexi bacterium]|nr:hypothetical protein [Chloroflexota bacterium]